MRENPMSLKKNDEACKEILLLPQSSLVFRKLSIFDGRFLYSLPVTKVGFGPKNRGGMANRRSTLRINRLFSRTKHQRACLGVTTLDSNNSLHYF
jgi:hypothetical protein